MVRFRAACSLDGRQSRFVRSRQIQAETGPIDLTPSRLNREFHFRLAEAAEMPLLHATIESMWAQMGPLIHLYHLHTPARVLVSGDHGHYQVLRALSEGNAAAARAAIQTDIGVGAVMVDWLEANGTNASGPPHEERALQSSSLKARNMAN